MTVGQRIKARRKQLGMNAETLADKLGVSPSTIYRYESGAIEKVDVAIIGPIAEALNTTPGYLMGWEDKIQKVQDSYENYYNEALEQEAKELDVLTLGLKKLKANKSADYEMIRNMLHKVYPEYFGKK